jgi:hypothetical protein
MATLADYMARYEQEHHNPWNRVLRGVGIPLIFAGVILLILLRWKLGLALFAGGWAMLLAGHKIEGNHPAFFQGPVYFLVGPIWVAREALEMIRGGRKTGATTANR